MRSVDEYFNTSIIIFSSSSISKFSDIGEFLVSSIYSRSFLIYTISKAEEEVGESALARIIEETEGIRHSMRPV